MPFHSMGRGELKLLSSGAPPQALGSLLLCEGSAPGKHKAGGEVGISGLFRFCVEFPDITEEQSVNPSSSFHFESVDNSLSLSTQVLPLNNASGYKEKRGTEKAEKRNTQGGEYVIAPSEKLSCLSTWARNQGRWNVGAPCC